MNIVEIVAKFINETSGGIKEVKNDISGLEGQQKSATSAGDNFADSLLGSALAGVTVGAVLGGVVSGLKATIDAYGEAEVVGARVNAVLQSTGGIAGVTAEDVDDLATRLSKLSGVDDELIASGEAVLLTFTKIGKDVFPQAMEAALNMSMAMGTDLQGSIIQVGKAMNDPIQGASALRRVGVQLTDQQEEQIKKFVEMNDLASAQGIILNELATEFGGVAEAMGDTTVGQSNKLKIAWGNLLEELGKEPAGTWSGISSGLTAILDDLTSLQAAQNAEMGMLRRAEDAWNANAEAMGLSIEAYDELMIAQGTNFYEFSKEFEQRELYNARLEDTNELLHEHAMREYDVVEATAAVYDAQSDLALSMDAVKAGVQGVIRDAYDRYTEKLTDLQTKHTDLEADLKQLQDWGWSPTSEKVQDVTQKLRDNEQAQKDAAAAMQDAIDKMIYQQASAGLDAEAQLELARAMGIIDEESYAVARATQSLKKDFEDGKLTAQEYASKVADLRDNVNSLKDRHITITVDTVQTGFSAQQQNYIERDKKKNRGESTLPGGYARGGISTGPASGHWELLHGDEAVIPLEGGSVPVRMMDEGKQGNVVQNYFSITLQVSSLMNSLDEQNAQNALLPVFIEAYHQARAQGAID